MGGGGNVVGMALAVALATGVKRENPRSFGQPAGSLGPLARVAAKARENKDRQAVPTEVEASEADPVSLEIGPVAPPVSPGYGFSFRPLLNRYCDQASRAIVMAARTPNAKSAPTSEVPRKP